MLATQIALQVVEAPKNHLILPSGKGGGTKLEMFPLLKRFLAAPVLKYKLNTALNLLSTHFLSPNAFRHHNPTAGPTKAEGFPLQEFGVKHTATAR